MKSLRRRASVLAAVVVACTCLVVAHNASANWDSTPVDGFSVAQDYACGPNDLPEGDIQGDIPQADKDSGRAQQGYNCGLALVGHAKIFNGDPPATKAERDAAPEKTGNANMAWIGNCAFVSGPSSAVAPESKPTPAPDAGVAVIDVTNPRRPEHVATLQDPGTLSTSETIGAVTVGTHGILVVGQYGNDQVSDPKPMDIYTLDLHQPCASIKDHHVTTFMWPDNIHNLTISPDGRYVFATQPLQALDISDIANPRYIGNLDDHLAGPMFSVGPSADLDDGLPAQVNEAQHPSYTSHEAWPLQRMEDDGRLHTVLYLGAQLPVFELFTIADVTDFLADPVHNVPQIISQRSGRGHSVRTATIGGHRYVLHSEESPFGAGFSCVPETANPFAGPSQPWLTNIDNEADPGDPVQFGLEINKAENCPEQLRSDLDDSVHYHDVDDQNDTHFVMASMWNAGLRVFDVHDFPNTPPREVAYFNPGDVDPTTTSHLDHAWGHIRYVKDKGQIWFATADGGFWVVGIEDQVWDHLGLPSQHADGILRDGWPGTTGVALSLPALGYVDVTPYYCTLGTARGANVAVLNP